MTKKKAKVVEATPALPNTFLETVGGIVVGLGMLVVAGVLLFAAAWSAGILIAVAEDGYEYANQNNDCEYMNTHDHPNLSMLTQHEIYGHALGGWTWSKARQYWERPIC